MKRTQVTKTLRRKVFKIKTISNPGSQMAQWVKTLDTKTSGPIQNWETI